MNFVDIGVFIVVILSILIGWKRGVIKSAVRLVGLIVIAIIAYQFKGMLASFLMSFLPFFNFGGIFTDIDAINILFYNGVSFIFIFLMLFCILNILINVAGIFDKLLKATIILYLPDKILGAAIGLIEGVIISFLLIFTATQIPAIQNYVLDSMYASRILNRTPVIRTVLADTIVTVEDINDASDEFESDEDTEKFHIEILNIMIKYGFISKESAQNLIDNEKIDLPLVTFN